MFGIDPTVLVALISLLGIPLAHWLGRRQRTADVARVVQDTYQELLADAKAQATAAREEASEARASARTAVAAAAAAEADAFHAHMWARAMARFLAEIRPLIAQHFPEPEPYLGRLDKLATIPINQGDLHV